MSSLKRERPIGMIKRAAKLPVNEAHDLLRVVYVHQSHKPRVIKRVRRVIEDRVDEFRMYMALIEAHEGYWICAIIREIDREHTKTTRQN